MEPMRLYKIAWGWWIIGTILVVLSSFGAVSPEVGWIGFGVAMIGTLLSGVAHYKARKPPRW